MMHTSIRSLLLLFFLGLSILTSSAAAAKQFTVIIDPGHGGKDTGTLGTVAREKDIVLAVGLKLGTLIKENNPDVKVIFTRNTDVFIPLDQRANIANKTKANLFISIHADHSESPNVKGVSTFTLGQNRTHENFEIAKRENSVILLEDNYKKRYEGFDPNSAESYIMFEFMQDNYMNQSIQFASTLQHKFSNAGRNNRGVRQDVFLVLRCTSMPSVLVELGFLSNREEENYLLSEGGQNQMARSLYNGFLEFKKDYERKSTDKQSSSNTSSGNNNNTEDVSVKKRNSKNNIKDSSVIRTFSQKTKILKSEEPKNEAVDKQLENEIVFKIQLLASTYQLPQNDKQFKGLMLDFYVEKNLYKYTFGRFPSFEEANRKRREFKTSFPDAFIIAFKNGQKINVNEARALNKH
jgi:N-acetylmuramoyl-L-alanine amidase